MLPIRALAKRPTQRADLEPFGKFTDCDITVAGSLIDASLGNCRACHRVWRRRYTMVARLVLQSQDQKAFAPIATKRSNRSKRLGRLATNSSQRLGQRITITSPSPSHRLAPARVPLATASRALRSKRAIGSAIE